jgi:hypothetical protein
MMDRLLSRLALVTALVILPAAAFAQIHASGDAWIHRDAPMGTKVHAPGDPLCALEFPASCHHGMMSPDSLYCSWRTVPPDNMPVPMVLYCLVAVRCEIRDERGQMMMPGHMTPSGLFRNPLALSMHYDPAVVATLGIDPANLVLTAWVDGTPTVITGAVHDQGASLFTLSTTSVMDWYAISDRTALPTGVEATTWGQVKAMER